MHRVLTIEDLVQFCEQRNFAHFSSTESGYQICVQSPAKFEKAESDDPLTFYGNVLAFHTGDNLNHSHLTEEAARKAMKSLSYKPVLANFCEIDGVRDFTSHDFDVDSHGNYTYYEKQVGCFTADKPQIKEDKDHEGRLNVFAKVAIPREYTDAADIIERKGGTAVSVEMAVNELSYSATDHQIILEDVDILGLTCLGVNPDSGENVKPGMENAHIQIEDFSVQNNSMVFNRAELINDITADVMDRLSNNTKTTERRNDVVDNFEEKPVEEIETTEEETQVVDTEAVEATEDAANETPEVVEDFEEEKLDEENLGNENFEDDDPEDEEEPVEEEAVIDDDTLPKKKYSVNGKEFELSLSDIQCAISELVNNTYGESDNDYYGCEVYQESKSVVMVGLWSGKAYRQTYKVRNGIYSLTGDRVVVHSNWLTEDEEAQLDKMRQNYDAIESKLAKYESEPQKMEILNSDDYASIAEMAEFVELKKEENHFNMSVEEVQSKADELLLSFAKSGKIGFVKDGEKKSVTVKQFGSKKPGKLGRYGNLFKK